MSKLTCLSSGKSLTNSVGSVKFLCPQCQKYEIVRSIGCRKNGTKYTCPNCGFEGP